MLTLPDLVKDAAEAATARFLDNLELIAQHFLSERESWHVNYGGYVAGDKPHDEQWQGLGPPDWLLQNIRDWYRDWKLTDDYLPGTEEDPDRTSPMIRSEGTSNMYAPPLLRMIRQITDLNENVCRQPDNHRRHERSWLCPRQCQAPQGNGSNSPACYKNRAWLPHSLYPKSNDGYRHFMYFYDCIRWAIDDVATLIDRGICLQHARSGTIHNGGKCFAFPCWKENVLAFNTRWTQWPTSEDDDLWDVYDF